MGSTPHLRNGMTPSRPTTTTSTPVHHNTGATVPPVRLSAPINAATSTAPVAPRRLVLPTRYMTLEPPQPLSAINDDPVFAVGAAAIILGVSVECMKKWRLRGQGPDYIQYGDIGPVRYALSELMAYRTAHTVVHAGGRK